MIQSLIYKKAFSNTKKESKMNSCRLFLISKESLLIIILLAYTLFVAGQTTYVFVGTFNREKKKEGIVVYRLDQRNRVLKKCSSVYGILNPSYLAIGHNSNFLYACTESQTKNAGSLTAFRFDHKKGCLSEINSQRSSGENPVYLTTDINHHFLISVNYTGGSLDVFRLRPSGIIDSCVQTIKFNKGSNASARQLTSHPHAIEFSPDHKRIFMTDLGADQIISYRFDPTQIHPVIDSTLLTTTTFFGSGPRHICFHPKLNILYCVEEISGTVSSYSNTDGQLHLKQRIALHKGTNGTYNSGDIHISSDGLFLYASNRAAENNIAVFHINKQGELTLTKYESTLGDHPRMFGLSPDGKFLIAANQLSGDVVVFNRDVRTGKLKFTKQKLKVKGPSCVQIQSYY